MPHIMDLDHLTITGDVHFGRNITLRGTVISKLRLLSDVLMCTVHIAIREVAASEGQRIDVPSGCILENSKKPH